MTRTPSGVTYWCAFPSDVCSRVGITPRSCNTLSRKLLGFGNEWLQLCAWGDGRSGGYWGGCCRPSACSGRLCTWGCHWGGGLCTGVLQLGGTPYAATGTLLCTGGVQFGGAPAALRGRLWTCWGHPTGAYPPPAALGGRLWTLGGDHTFCIGMGATMVLYTGA
jgi:hypothetical protein